MPRIVGIELFELDLPFRHPFRHSAAERETSGSIFARFFTDTGHCGYGETLPRTYVTGEERGETFDLLTERILPRVLDMEVTSWNQLHEFLSRCDGKAPADWVDPETPQTAAWCLVDIGLLDTFGRALGIDLHEGLPGIPSTSWPGGTTFSAVLSGEAGRSMLGTLLKIRLYGVRDVKLKVGNDPLPGVRLAHRVLGRGARLRVDCNMAWTLAEAERWMPLLAEQGVGIFEQPLRADDLEGMAHLVKSTGLGVMADESVHDAASFERIIDRRACTAVNIRIAKCGGVIASLARSRRAAKAGLAIQIGCQVGESSHLSAAQLVLIRSVGNRVKYLEGSFGARLLTRDPVRPLLQFGRGGRPPPRPGGGGFGTEVDMEYIRRHSARQAVMGSIPQAMEDCR